MTDTLKADKFKKFSRGKRSEFDEFSAWLGSIGLLSAPKLHVNGSNFSTAVVTVDFGTPLVEPTKLTAEQNAELVARMKGLTKSLHKTEVNVRIQNDSANGVWWSTIN